MVLSSQIYGCVARYEIDPHRSNAAGKSLLGESILYALFGWTAPERGFDASGWISDGAKEGAVEIEFSDGWWVRRSRKNKVWDLETSTGAHKDFAQTEIDQRLVLSNKDIQATRYVKQKSADRFSRALSSDRMAVVSEWLRLQSLDECAEEAGSRAKVAEDAMEDLRRRAAEASGFAHRLLAGIGAYDPERDEFTHDEDDFLRVLVENEAAAKQRLDEAEKMSLAGFEMRESQRLLRERDEVEEAGRAAKRRREAMGPPTEEHLALAQDDLAQKAATMAEAERESDRKRKVALGLFDGACPVARIHCPAKAQINGDRGRGGEEARVAREAVVSAREAWDAADTSYRTMIADADRARRAEDEVEQHRSQYASLTRKIAESVAKLAAMGVDDVLAEFAGDEVPVLREAYRKASADRAAAERAFAQFRDELSRSKELDRQASEREAEARLARDAQAVFRAARSRIGEAALAELQASANAALAEMDPGIGFELRWGREGKDPAKQCSRCGRAFSRGVKEKSCSSCGEPRGKQVQEKLDFVFRDQSGGMEDLCGLFLQLAAGAWLCRDRTCPHAWAVLDEPGAHLDAALRGSLARKLPRMLARLGVEQAIVVAHDSAAIDALPGRILVERGADGFSTARVIE